MYTIKSVKEGPLKAPKTTSLFARHRRDAKQPLLSVFLAAWLLASCRTMPQAPYPPLSDWLPPESSLILRFTVSGNQELAGALLTLLGFSPENIEPVLERTAQFAASMETVDGGINVSTMPVHAVALGLWPRGVLGGVLGRDWKRSAAYEWQGPEGLSLAAPSNEIILLSRGRLSTLAANRNEGGQSWDKLPPQADFALLMDDARLIGGMFPPAAGLVNALSLALNKVEGEGYKIILNFYPSNPELAGAFVPALRLALAARFGSSKLEEEKALLKKVKIEAAEDRVILSLPPVSLALLTSLAGGLPLFAEQP
ncbi:MAG: hypothetical protein B0D92_05090 [Spirochaeta sp. LUC14_002_19_P3]|nr:MAG: hypothetical protein B0D92_05090 [Spirochaeta sp. LUC14_002_19_P3]